MTAKRLVNFRGQRKIFNMPLISILMSFRANVKSQAEKIPKDKIN